MSLHLGLQHNPLDTTVQYSLKRVALSVFFFFLYVHLVLGIELYNFYLQPRAMRKSCNDLGLSGASMTNISERLISGTGIFIY